MSNEEYIDELMRIARSGTPEAEMRAQFERVIAAHETNVLQNLTTSFDTAAANPSGLKLPDPDPSGKSYRLYKDRPFITGSKRRILATEHLKNEWQKYIDAGLLNGEKLRALDADLVRALYNQEAHEKLRKNATWKVHDLLETRTNRVRAEDAIFSSTQLGEAILRFAHRIRMRRSRENGTTHPEPATPDNE